MDNFAMDITATISHNLSAWMDAKPTLGTLKKVAAKAKIGFGTVRRARNGDGNTTIQNLDAIARAFGRRVEHLLAEPAADGKVATLPEREPPALEPPLDAIVTAALAMSKEGRHVLLGRAEELALRFPAAKPKRQSSP